jgi:hypothetical protein
VTSRLSQAVDLKDEPFPGLLNVEAGKARLAPIRCDFHFAGVYSVACTQPGTVVGLGHREGTATGLGLLLYGWMPGLQVVLPRLSNFLWLAGLVLLARGRLGWALGCSAVGLLFASLVLLPLPELGGRLLEAKWWWLGSHAALAVSCGLAWFLRPAPRPLTVDPDFSDSVRLKSSD